MVPDDGIDMLWPDGKYGVCGGDVFALDVGKEWLSEVVGEGDDTVLVALPGPHVYIVVGDVAWPESGQLGSSQPGVGQDENNELVPLPFEVGPAIRPGVGCGYEAQDVLGGVVCRQVLLVVELQFEGDPEVFEEGLD